MADGIGGGMYDYAYAYAYAYAYVYVYVHVYVYVYAYVYICIRICRWGSALKCHLGLALPKLLNSGWWWGQ